MAQPRSMYHDQPVQGSAHALLATFVVTLAEAVDATLEEGLDQTCAPPDVRDSVAAVWRDRIAFAAAEAMSERLAHPPMHAGTTPLDRVKLRRLLREYSSLVAAEARVAMSSARHAEFAAD